MQYLFAPAGRVVFGGRSVSCVALLCLLLLAGPGRCWAQAPAWELAMSGNNSQPGTGNSSIRAVAADARGNLFVTGSFTGTIMFDNILLTNTGSGTTTDMFVAKWDATVQDFTWATSGGGTGNDAGYGIAVSGLGIFVTGSFASGTAARIAGQPLAGVGSQDIFVAKYLDTSTGNTPATSSFANAWVISDGGTGGDISNSIAINGMGIFVTGQFDSGTSASFAGQSLTGAGGLDVFVAKYHRHQHR